MDRNTMPPGQVGPRYAAEVYGYEFVLVVADHNCMASCVFVEGPLAKWIVSFVPGVLATPARLRVTPPPFAGAYPWLASAFPPVDIAEQARDTWDFGSSWFTLTQGELDLAGFVGDVGIKTPKDLTKEQKEVVCCCVDDADGNPCGALISNNAHSLSSHLRTKHTAGSAYQAYQSSGRRYRCRDCDAVKDGFNAYVYHQRSVHEFRGAQALLFGDTV